MPRMAYNTSAENFEHELWACWRHPYIRESTCLIMINASAVPHIYAYM